MPNTAPKPKNGISLIAPYVGGESTTSHPTRLIRLAANESNYGASPLARQAFLAASHDLHRYPDGHCQELRHALADYYGLDYERIICGTGSGDLINLIARVYCGSGDSVVYSEHGFLMYPIASHANGATPITAKEKNYTSCVESILTAVTAQTKIVFLANPNNPTGTYLPKQEVARLVAQLPKSVMLVLDAAYADFPELCGVADYDSGFELAKTAPNLVIARTFSKLYGLAALRLGWLYGPTETIDYLNRIRGPFNVNAPVQAAAIAALKDRDFAQRVAINTAATRALFCQKLTAMGLKTVPSIANFVLVEFSTDSPRAAKDAQQWLKQEGVLTRMVAAYGLPNHLRITIGLEEEMAIVAQLIEQFLTLNREQNAEVKQRVQND